LILENTATLFDSYFYKLCMYRRKHT